MFRWIAPQFNHVSKYSIWVFLGDEAIWKKIWLFTKNFWNFKAIPKNHFDVCSKQTGFEKFKRFSWIGLHEC